jgi:hypothetical protein
MQSYQLVYKRYLEVGFCKENHTKMYFGFHELLTDTRTFIAEIDGKVIATLSVIIDNSAGLPSDHLFLNELNSFRDPSRKIAEISRFAVSSEYKKFSITIFHYLFQLLYHSYVISSNVTDCVILVEPRHCKLYKKFNFVEVSNMKLDEDANQAESKLMRLVLRDNGQLIQYPCFASSLKDLKGFSAFLTDALLKHQELNCMYQKFIQNKPLTVSKEISLFNFRGYLMNSYLHNAKIELEDKNNTQKSYTYNKFFSKLLESWPTNYLDKLRAQVEQLKDSCYNSLTHELPLSHVS